jgi:hypothetical protein
MSGGDSARCSFFLLRRHCYEKLKCHSELLTCIYLFLYGIVNKKVTLLCQCTAWTELTQRVTYFFTTFSVQ